MSAPFPLMAIDPGAVSGAYALLGTSYGAVVDDIGVVERQVDGAAFARIVKSHGVRAAVVEQVASMPGQGVSSTFKFGMAVGIIRGVLAALNVPLITVAPQVWKRHHNLIGKDKEASRALAIRLCPDLMGLERKKDQGRAEALLIGLWYLHHRYGIQPARSYDHDRHERPQSPDADTG